MSESWRTNLGKIEYEARSRLNMSSTDVSEGLGVSQPTVTNFENGRSDMSLSRFYQVLNRLYMTPAEYFARVDGRTDFLSHFMREMRSANRTDDLAAYTKIRKEVEATYPRSHKSPGPIDMLLLSIKGMAAAVKNNRFTFSYEDALQIEEFMNRDKNWFEFEYAVFSLTCQFLPMKNALPIFQNMLTAFAEHPIYFYRATFNAIVFNFCVSLMMNHNYPVAAQLLNQVQKETTQAEGSEFARVVYVLRQASVYLTDESHAAAQALSNIKRIEGGLVVYSPKESEHDLHLLELLGIELGTA